MTSNQPLPPPLIIDNFAGGGGASTGIEQALGRPVSFASICSGIEAASVAWHPLGWKTVFLAEVDKFASRLLAERFPEVPNYGDITRYAMAVPVIAWIGRRIEAVA